MMHGGMTMNGPARINTVMPTAHHHEMLIPGNKVGLVIGKGGETIKAIQEQCQCKIAFTQDISIRSEQEKSLRLSGEPHCVEKAKKMVSETLCTDRLQNQFGSGRVTQTIQVPRPMVGMVIGKGGEIIRKIQDDFGVRLQFDQDNKISPERVCTVIGSPDRVKDAIDRVNQIMYAGPTMQGVPPRAPNRLGGGDGRTETTFQVPADKCGLVIGRNGVTINEIKNQSGAHVEIQKNQPDNVPHKSFTIIGDQQQTSKAIELISQKIGQNPDMNTGHSYASQYASTGPMAHQAQPGAYTQGWGDAAFPYANQPFSQQAVPVTSDPSQAAAMATDWSGYYTTQNYWAQPTSQQAQQTVAATTAQNIGQEAVNRQQPNYVQAWYDYFMAIGQYDSAQQLVAQHQVQLDPQGVQNGWM